MGDVHELSRKCRLCNVKQYKEKNNLNQRHRSYNGCAVGQEQTDALCLAGGCPAKELEIQKVI